MPGEAIMGLGDLGAIAGALAVLALIGLFMYKKCVKH
jgi:malic enzyme